MHVAAAKSRLVSIRTASRPSVLGKEREKIWRSRTRREENRRRSSPQNVEGRPCASIWPDITLVGAAFRQ